MLIGVQTGPSNKPRRDGVRASWKRWEKDLPGVLICFLVGRKPGDTGDGIGLAKEKLAELDAEAIDGALVQVEKLAREAEAALARRRR